MNLYCLENDCYFYLLQLDCDDNCFFFDRIDKNIKYWIGKVLKTIVFKQINCGYLLKDSNNHVFFLNFNSVVNKIEVGQTIYTKIVSLKTNSRYENKYTEVSMVEGVYNWKSESIYITIIKQNSLHINSKKVYTNINLLKREMKESIFMKSGMDKYIKRVEFEIDKITPVVYLEKSGSIIFEHTSLGFTVDINSGNISSYEANSKALKILFKYLSSCNLSGLIIVDFAGLNTSIFEDEVDSFLGNMNVRCKWIFAHSMGILIINKQSGNNGYFSRNIFI